MMTDDNRLLKYNQSTIESYPTVAQRLIDDRQLLNFWQQLPAGLDNWKILDVGCGDGDITRRLASLNPNSHVVGVDISAPFITKACQTEPHMHNVEFKVMDLHTLEGIENNSLDLIISSYSITQVHLGDLDKVIKKFASKLKQGGKIRLLTNTIEGRGGSCLPQAVLDDRVYPLTLKNSTHDDFNLFNCGVQQSELVDVMTCAGFQCQNVQRVEYSESLGKNYAYRDEVDLVAVIVEAVLS